MKKFLLLVLLVTCTFAARSQSFQGDQAILGQIGYQSNFERVLLGAQYRYTLFSNLRVAPDATFYFPKDNITGLDFNLNLQYAFDIDYQLSIYPLAGLNMANNRFSGKLSNGKKIDSQGYTDWGFNLGAGTTYFIGGGNTFINIEAKYVFSDTDAFSFGVGVGTKF